jgi:hypothetical protein
MSALQYSAVQTGAGRVMTKICSIRETQTYRGAEGTFTAQSPETSQNFISFLAKRKQQSGLVMGLSYYTGRQRSPSTLSSVSSYNNHAKKKTKQS